MTSGKDNTEDLTVKVKEYQQDDLAHIKPSMLTMWIILDKAPAFKFEDLDTMQCLVSEAFFQRASHTTLPISEDSNSKYSPKQGNTCTGS